MENISSIKVDSLPDLDDLLQCPVCYEIPLEQIFQCNEGHHVCGPCKMRLDRCPVCRSLFFGTRNYALEELIANIRKLQAFKIAGKLTLATEDTTPKEPPPPPPVTAENINAVNDIDATMSPLTQLSYKGLFRCLCCPKENVSRLPAARLLNHIRYFHAQDLIEGVSDNGAYMQRWQVPTMQRKFVLALRVSDMGIFFLTIEIMNSRIWAWVSMATVPWVASTFSYTITFSGVDRELMFTDRTQAVKNCEGALKKAGRCLFVNGHNYDAFTTMPMLNCKLTLKRLTVNEATRAMEPRGFMRIADRNRSNIGSGLGDLIHAIDIDIGQRLILEHDNEPFLPRNLRANNASLNNQNRSANIAERHFELYTRNLRRRMNQRLRAALDTYRLSPTEGERRQGQGAGWSASSGPSNRNPVGEQAPTNPTATVQGRTNRRRRRLPR